MPIFLDRHDLSGLTAADIAEAHRSAKAKSSPSVTPNLAANPAKKKQVAKTAEACIKLILSRSRRGLATSGEHSGAGV